ncbi:MAG: hypothetical protein PWQ57_1171 [Desulfovibrionales bacterium]|nr:hypothetical protein [Desulfovibrionales bacterium]
MTPLRSPTKGAGGGKSDLRRDCRMGCPFGVVAPGALLGGLAFANLVYIALQFFPQPLSMLGGENMEFGFLMNSSEVTFGDITIAPLSNYNEVVQQFYEKASVANGWIYPPLKRVAQNFNEKKRFSKDGPEVPATHYYLSPTHSIHSQNIDTDDEHLRFLILCYGFLHGFYLLKDQYSYFMKTPYVRGKLHSLMPSGKDLESGMTTLNNLYQCCNEENRKRIFAIIHWFLVSGSYEMAWDHFDAQYKVLDGVYKYYSMQHRCKMIPHACRPALLADVYGVQLPKWAITSKDSKSQLSLIRNGLTHEAFFAGEPIGYSYPKENFRLELTNFNMKLICGVLGLRTPYLFIAPEDRQMHTWNLPPV